MRAKIEQCLQRLRCEERGLTTVEYAIVLCLIAVVAVMTWKEFGALINDNLEEGTTEIEKAFK